MKTLIYIYKKMEISDLVFVNKKKKRFLVIIEISESKKFEFHGIIIFFNDLSKKLAHYLIFLYIYKNIFLLSDIK